MSQHHMSLNSIGLAAGTDKASVEHNYLQFYESFFEGLRQRPLRLLEIGILNGASLKTWETYFPNASIIGADINPDTRRFGTARTKVEIVDQSNAQDMVDLGVKHGPFDIIIEDGSHLWEHQITSLKLLFPFVKVGGFYVVEDLQTNYGDLAAEFQGHASISCVEYLKKLLDYRVAGEKADVTSEEDYFLRTYGPAVNYMAFYRHACLIKKGQPATAGQRILPEISLMKKSNAEIELVKLNAHIGDTGDVTGETPHCLNLGPASVSAFQAYELVVPRNIVKHLRYRARLENGTWTTWVSGNNFAGTSGENINLAGFTIEFRGAVASRYQIKIAGCFSNGDVIIVDNGEDCVSSDDHALLTGIQIRIEQPTETPGQKAV